MTLATPEPAAIRPYLPPFPSAAQYLLKFIMDAAAAFAWHWPDGVHGGIPTDVPSDLPMRVIHPASNRRAFFRVGKVIQTKLRRPEDGQKETVYGIIVHPGNDSSECLLVEDFGHLGTVRSNHSDPPCKHGIIYTTPCPPSPLRGEKTLYGAVFASKFAYFVDLPHAARVNYRSLFAVRHDAEVYPVAQLDAEGLAALCLNYEDATGGHQLQIEFPRPPGSPALPPCYSSLFPVSESEVD